MATYPYMLIWTIHPCALLLLLLLLQEDTFHPTQTVLEAVIFQASMRLDSSIPHSKKKYMARELIKKAGLKGKVGEPPHDNADTHHAKL